MSNYRRPRATGATIFFTVCLADRRSDLLVREIVSLREAVRATRSERPFEIISWVVLPNHLHCIWRLPVGDGDFSTRWGAIKSRFTRAVMRRPGFSPAPGFPVVTSGKYAGLKPGLRSNKRERTIWQRRFWEHHIRNKEDLARHIKYCWFNPVKHGLVEHSSEWPYSTFHADVRAGRVSEGWCTQGFELETGE